jgi:tRNA pseudouridine32 synthase / 23S rRNA pseudouridine746 synthase
VADRTEPDYYYRGRCPRSGQWLELPRTQESEAVARELMAELGDDLAEGKMYGVLLGRQRDGQPIALKAFSGLWQGQSHWPGWVPPIPGRQLVAELEVATLEKLAAIAQELQTLKTSPLHQLYQAQQATADRERQQLNDLLQIRRQERQQQRQQHPELAPQLDRASRGDSATKRQLKEYWQGVLQPLAAAILELEQRAQHLREQRRQLSGTLQSQMYRTASITNFRGESLSLRELRPSGLPTGSGECCAPKLLHYAASAGITPIAMAEFWWGEASGDKQPGQFYSACADRCQPLMGFMLSGLSAHLRSKESEPLGIIYEDEYLLAIDKPAGLLSVPGRYGQDHVGQRLQRDMELYPVHRLDRDTSGLLLLAKDLDSYRQLAGAFAQGRVQKIYHGILVGAIECQSGTIDLPLYGDPGERPRQRVDTQLGKPSRTHFRLLAEDDRSRVEFQPVTGRTHQIRVHAARGLGMPLLGDRLYGNEAIDTVAQASTNDSSVVVGGASLLRQTLRVDGVLPLAIQHENRLYLHAYQLTFAHPSTGVEIVLCSTTPF